MTTLVIAVLAISGTLFLLLAGIGMIRLPDLFCRTSATTKAATLGVGCLLIAVAIHFGDLRVTTRALATIAFLLLTAPVAAHMIARAGVFPRRQALVRHGSRRVSDQHRGTQRCVQHRRVDISPATRLQPSWLALSECGR